MKKFSVAAALLAGLLLGGCAGESVKSNKLPVGQSAEAAVTLTSDTAQTADKGSKRSDSPKMIVVDEAFSNLSAVSPEVPMYDKLTVAERQERGLKTALPALEPLEREKVAYLTFDDGPDTKNTPAVLDVLQQSGVKATFYLVGSYVEAYPEVVKRIYEEGHAIGNHTFSHDYDKLYSSPEAFVADLAVNDEAIRRIIGVRPLIVRAPGGSMGQFDEGYWQALKAAGYVEHDWNVSSADADPNDPVARDFVDNIDGQTADGKRTAVILMHSSAGHEETVKALPEIIRLLRERGYRFGVVTPLTPGV